MINEHDDKKTRCRRLGHEVTFGYCREEREGKPCRLIQDCWWQSFEVQSFLREHLSEEDYQALVETPPPNKVLSLYELIRQAQTRAKASASDPDQAPDSEED